jgi:predicted esterase
MPEFIHEFAPGNATGRGLTLLLLHGTGGDERALLPMAPLLEPGAAVLSPRGKVLEQGRPRFFRRLAEGVFDLEDLKLRAHELADFVETASARYGFNPRRVIAAGYSNGANIAAAVLLLRPRTLAGAVLFRPMVLIMPDELPGLVGMPVFISAGRQDPIVRPEETKRLAKLLGDAGADVTLNWSANGHWLGPEEIALARQWLVSLPIASAASGRAS